MAAQLGAGARADGPGDGYVHGYSDDERERLSAQARTLVRLLHDGTAYAPGARVLEAGCGVGAQTVTLAQRSPGARIVAVDHAAESLAVARERVRAAGGDNVSFHEADLYCLPFGAASFDHVFVCFVLEHLRRPEAALAELGRVLRPGGTITVIEGDHGSCYFHPETPAARHAWQCLVTAQARLGGDALIGRRLYPLLRQAGFRVDDVGPRVVYCDARSPALVDGFVRQTIAGMVAGARPQVQVEQLSVMAWFDQGVSELQALAERPDVTFSYTFFKAVAVR